MGKLSHEEAMASENAAKKFERANDHSSSFTITVVKDSESVFIENDVEVRVYPKQYGGADLRRVDIFWEEAGIKNYRDLGLYGMYSCVYCRMEYKSETLIIYSDNGIKIFINGGSNHSVDAVF